MEKNRVYVNRSFECGIHELFDWLTQPELIAQWFGPEGLHVVAIENEPQVEGVYRMKLQKQNGQTFEIHGQYLTWHPPNLVQFTYQYEGLPDPPPPSQVTFRLNITGPQKTQLAMIQEFESEVPDFTTRTRAWNFMLSQLRRLTTADKN